eukprot:760068-Hanusia_phi.AAC.1
MIRRCIESSGCFGLCPSSSHPLAGYGCLLRIESFNYLHDGRCEVRAYGVRRFRVEEEEERDGYVTAKARWIEDNETEKNTWQEHELLNPFARPDSFSVWMGREENAWLSRGDKRRASLKFLQEEQGQLAEKSVDQLFRYFLLNPPCADLLLQPLAPLLGLHPPRLHSSRVVDTLPAAGDPPLLLLPAAPHLSDPPHQVGHVPMHPSLLSFWFCAFFLHTCPQRVRHNVSQPDSCSRAMMVAEGICKRRPFGLPRLVALLSPAAGQQTTHESRADVAKVLESLRDFMKELRVKNHS